MNIIKGSEIPDNGITDANLRLFVAGRLPEDSAEYEMIRADLEAHPEDGRTARYLKAFESFGENVEDINWGKLVESSVEDSREEIQNTFWDESDN